jgi:hypothetical protein
MTDIIPSKYFFGTGSVSKDFISNAHPYVYQSLYSPLNKIHMTDFLIPRSQLIPINFWDGESEQIIFILCRPNTPLW